MIVVGWNLVCMSEIYHQKNWGGLGRLIPFDFFVFDILAIHYRIEQDDSFTLLHGKDATGVVSKMQSIYTELVKVRSKAT